MAELPKTVEEWGKLYLLALRSEIRGRLEEVLMKTAREQVRAVADEAMKHVEAMITHDFDVAMGRGLVQIVVGRKNLLGEG